MAKPYNHTRVGMSMDEVAKELGLTRPQVRDIEKSALRKLRIYLRGGEYEDFLVEDHSTSDYYPEEILRWD